MDQTKTITLNLEGIINIARASNSMNHWARIGHVLLVADSAKIWIHQGYTNKTDWLRPLANKFKVRVSQLDRMLNTARYIQENQVYWQRAGVTIDLDDLDRLCRLESFEVLSQIEEYCPPGEFLDHLKNTLEGSLSRQDIRDIKARYLP